jgi:zinc protease
MVFVIVGDFDATKVEARARELFKDFKRTPIDPVFIPEEPQQFGRREAHEERPINLSRQYFAWHICDARHADAPALDLLAHVLGNGKSSRLYRQLRDKKGLVQSVSASAYTPGQPGLFYITTSLEPAKRADTERELLAEIRKVISKGITPAELEKAKQIAFANQFESLKTMEGQAQDLGTNEVVAGDLGYTRRYLERVARLTAADIARVAKTYLGDDNYTVVSVNPTGTLGKLARPRVERAEMKLSKFELPNGLRVVVREDPRLPFVNFYAAAKGGLLAETDDNNGISSLMARLLLKGTRTRSAEQIAEAIEGGGGSISATGGNNSLGVAIEVLRPDFDKAMDVLADVLLRSTFPDEAVERERQIQLNAIKTEKEAPTAAAQKLVRRMLFNAHPYHMTSNGTEKSVAGIQRGDIIAFRDRYLVPNNMVLAVCGDVKAADVRRAVEKHFGRQKRAAHDPLPPRKPAAPLTSAVRQEEIAPRQQAVIFIGFRGVHVASPDRFAMEVLDQSLSGLDSPLFRRLRDELALCYYTGATQLLALDPGYFVFYVGTEPAKAKLAEAELLKEIEKICRQGLNEEAVVCGRNKLIGEHKINLQSNATLASQIALDELYGLGYKFSLDFEKHYGRITAADVQRAAARYLKADTVAIGVVRPAEKKNTE